MGWRLNFLRKTLVPKCMPFSTARAHLAKKIRKKRKKPESPITTHVTPLPSQIPHFEELVERDIYFRFLTRTKQFLSQQPEQVLLLDDAGKLYQQLGFPRGRKIARFLGRHPLLFETYRHDDGKMWLGFSSLMNELLDEERDIIDSLEEDRINKVRKLLMMSVDRQIVLNKLHQCRLLFGLPDDFRERVLKYEDYFKVFTDEQGQKVLKLRLWDASLAVSDLERVFVHDEEEAKTAFRFPVKHAKKLGLREEDMEKLEILNTLPLISPYADKGKALDSESLEAEKYRVGVLHEFLSLTLEKKASIHQVVEFKKELSLNRQTYEILKRQYRTFYLGGTEMNWVVFLKHAYDEKGVLKIKDPLVAFTENLHKYAKMKN